MRPPSDEGLIVKNTSGYQNRHQLDINEPGIRKLQKFRQQFGLFRLLM